MADETLDQINARIEVLATEGQSVHDRLERALRKRDDLIAKKDQPLRDSVIKFYVQYDENGKVYSYVAHRAITGSWYVTGKAKPMNWDELVRLMRMDLTTKRFGGEIRFFLYGAGKGTPGRWQGRKQ